MKNAQVEETYTFQYDLFDMSIKYISAEKYKNDNDLIQLRFFNRDREIKKHRMTFKNQNEYISFLEHVIGVNWDDEILKVRNLRKLIDCVFNFDMCDLRDDLKKEQGEGEIS